MRPKLLGRLSKLSTITQLKGSSSKIPLRKSYPGGRAFNLLPYWKAVQHNTSRLKGRCNVPRQFTGQRRVLPTNGAGTTMYLHAKYQLRSFTSWTSHHIQNLNTKFWVRELKVRANTRKLFKETQKKKLPSLWVWKIFLRYNTKSITYKGKIWQLDSIKI